jgi:hypothetical protein
MKRQMLAPQAQQLTPARKRAARIPGWSWLLALARSALAFVAMANIAITAWLCINHLTFPLNLDLMEGTVLQHVQRAAAGQPIYPEPTPDYVPLAYNPLFYVLALPFSWILGLKLSTLRLLGILGYLGSGVVIYRVVRQHTTSAWWGIMAAGLFAAAYSVMDVYLDTAHSDSWLVCSALLGSYAIALNRSRFWDMVGVVLLVSSFWFKQHGALFAIGGLVFLTWRDGVVRSLPSWAIAGLLGPALYLFAGPYLFGSDFHYFTWTVPHQWSEVHLRTFKRYVGYNLLCYPILSLGAIFATYRLPRRTPEFDIWRVQFVFALLTGFTGSLDDGSSYNVYIPMGTFIILVGALGLHELASLAVVKRYGLHLAGLFVTFAVLSFNPFTVAVSGRADRSYADLIQMLRALGGPVYAPSLGQLEKGPNLYPAAHWVALEDMIRGPGRDTRNHLLTRRLLEPVINPSGPAFILANYPLDAEGFPPLLRFLLDDYVLETDLGNRFEPLRCLPKRYDHGWPRYLYRYAPAEAAARHVPQSAPGQ